MLRDDSAMNLSPEMFEKFIKPYDERILKEFNGGAIHFCGRGDHYIKKMSEMKHLYAINLSQPEYNNMEVIYKNTIDKGIKLLALDKKTAEEASLITFGGFNIIQILGFINGVYNKDYALIFGQAISIVACGLVTIQILIYKFKLLRKKKVV